MKKIINGILSLIGLELVRSEKSRNARFQIENAIAHNSLKRTNDFYANKQLVKGFISKDRLNLFDEIVQTINKSGIDLANVTMADFGCGTGHFLGHVANQFSNSKVIGFEFSEEAIQRAKEYFPEIQFQQHSVYEALSEKRFNLICCIEVLEHLEFPDKALINMYSHLEKNGTLLLTVPEGRKDTFEGHIHFWSPESWKLFIEKTLPDIDFYIGELKNGRFLYAIIQK